MDLHPLYANVADACRKYPDQAGCLWQAYLDLRLSQRWTDIEVIDLEENAGCCVLRAHDPKQPTGELTVVYPLSLGQSTSMAMLQLPFKTLNPSPGTVLLAISSEDSSIVYYKTSPGIIPPKEIKD